MTALLSWVIKCEQLWIHAIQMAEETCPLEYSKADRVGVRLIVGLIR